MRFRTATSAQDCLVHFSTNFIHQTSPGDVQGEPCSKESGNYIVFEKLSHEEELQRWDGVYKSQRARKLALLRHAENLEVRNSHPSKHDSSDTLPCYQEMDSTLPVTADPATITESLILATESASKKHLRFDSDDELFNDHPKKRNKL